MWRNLKAGELSDGCIMNEIQGCSNTVGCLPITMKGRIG